MASPKTGGQFYVETNRQTARALAAAQDSGRRVVDEVASLSRVYFDTWTAAQNTALETAFQLQNSTMQASQVVVDAALQANRRLFEEWARVVAEYQSAAARTVAAGVGIAGDSMPRGKV